MAEIFKPLQKAISTIVAVAQPDRIILFGSRATDQFHKESDLDLLVLKQNLKDKRTLTKKIYRNFHHIGAPVDVIVADLERFEILKNDPYLIYKEAADKGRVVYEKP